MFAVKKRNKVNIFVHWNVSKTVLSVGCTVTKQTFFVVCSPSFDFFLFSQSKSCSTVSFFEKVSAALTCTAVLEQCTKTIANFLQPRFCCSTCTGLSVLFNIAVALRAPKPFKFGIYPHKWHVHCLHKPTATLFIHLFIWRSSHFTYTHFVLPQFPQFEKSYFSVHKPFTCRPNLIKKSKHHIIVSILTIIVIPRST